MRASESHVPALEPDLLETQSHLPGLRLDLHTLEAHAHVLTTELPKRPTDSRDRTGEPPVWKSHALKRKIDRPKITIALPTVPIDVPNFGRHVPNFGRQVPNFELGPLNFGKDTAQLATDSHAMRTAPLI